MQLSIRSLILCISCSFLIFVTRAIDINSSSFATPTVTKTINRTTVRRASVPPIRTHDHGVAIPELGFVEDGGYKGNDASSTLDTSIVVDSRSFAGESLGMKPTVSQQQVHGLPAVLNSRSIQSLSTAGFTGNVETDYAKSGLLLRKTTNLYNMKLETKDLEGIISIYMPNNTALAFCKHVQEEPSGESEHAKRGEGAHHELSLNIGGTEARRTVVRLIVLVTVGVAKLLQVVKDRMDAQTFCGSGICRDHQASRVSASASPMGV
jgi:hypothetical protein